MSRNPFSAEVAQLDERGASRPTSPDFTRFGVLYAAEALWSLFAELPATPEATLAQRRLEEAVFWAGRAEQSGRQT